uniref:Lipoprotein n=1 Tax=Dulem virus 224 TaxID=3145701 RepID=A0AAU8AVZ9_9VIRU
MKIYKQSKKTIEKLMRKNGKETWWTILAALVVIGIQSCGSTWNLKDNQIKVEVTQNSKNGNRSRKKCNESANQQGTMDNGIHSSEQGNGGIMETNGSNE